MWSPSTVVSSVLLLSNYSGNSSGLHFSGNASSSNEAELQLYLVRQVFIGFCLFALSVLTAVGNFFVLYAVRTEKKLQTVSNMFIISLAVSDFIVGAIVMPVSAIYTLMDEWSFGLFFCQFWLATDYIASTASILNLFILSLDRYWSVTQPLRYLRRRTRRRARLMIGAVWILSSLWIIPLCGWHSFANGGVRLVPDNVCDTEYAENMPLKIATGLFNFFLPIFLMYGLYGRIFLEIQRRSLAELSSGNSQCQRDRYLGIPKTRDSQSITCSSPTFGHSVDIPTPAPSSSDTPPVQSNGCVVRDAGNTAVKQFEYYHDEVILDPKSERVLTVLMRRRFDSPGDYEWFSHGNPERTQKYENANTDDVANIQWTVTFATMATIKDREKPQTCVIGRSSKNAGVNVMFDDVTNRDQIAAPENSSTEIRHTQKVRKRRRNSCSLRKEKKAARQLGVIMGVFTLCFLPYFTLFLVVAVCNGCIPDVVMLCVTWIGYLNSTLNPFLYPLCNTIFRAKFKKMLVCRTPWRLHSQHLMGASRDRYRRSTSQMR